MAEIPKQVNGNGSGNGQGAIRVSAKPAPAPAQSAPVQPTPAQSASVQSAQPAQKSYSLDGATDGTTEAPKLSLLTKLIGKGENNSALPNTPQTASAGNTFTKLFGKAKEISALPAGDQSIAKLLGPKPKVSPGIAEEHEQRRASMAKGVFNFSLVLALLVYGFFYTQLNSDFTLFSDYFGPNRAVQFERSNAELKKVQTDLNLIRYRTARLWLDEINTNIDPFQRNTAVFNSDFSTGLQKQNASAELQILGASIKSALKEVQGIFVKPLGIDVYSLEPVAPEQREEIFATALTEELNRQMGVLSGEAQPNQEEIRIINNVIRLVDNKRFRSAIKNRNFDSISEGEFSKMLTEIREEATDELSAIDKIKRQRVNWGGVIQDVHAVTRKADLYYGQGLFKTVGGFLFNSYRFDAKAGRVSVNGITKTADNKTFSFIAQLVDSIEKSPRFKDIDFRSFSKNKDENGDYSSSINLDFTIQTEPDSRDDIPLVVTPANAP